jgi:glycosyltransferase involved in cell wall biosynthesis
MVKVLLRNPYAFLAANIKMLRTVRSFRPTHFYAFNQLYTLNFSIALALIRLPLIYRSGDEPTQHNWFWRLLWKFIAWRVHHFVAVSSFIRDRLVDAGVDEAHISIIYSPPPKRHAVGPAELPARASLPGTFCFVYVGQITKAKGVDLLLTAFSEVCPHYSNAHLLIGGPISDWAGHEWARGLRNKIEADLKLAQQIHFLGEVENALDLMKRCDVHVCPSVWEEPGANVVVEAKSMGIPSIVFPRGGLTEVVEHQVDGYVAESCSVTALTKAMLYYLDNPNAAKAHGVKALESLSKLQIEWFSARWLAIVTDDRSSS